MLGLLSDEAAPRLLPPTLTAREQRRLVGLERRKARQVRWAKRHNHGRYSRRLRRTIAQIAGLHARQARRRLDFIHKLTTDLAKSHGWVGIEDLRVKSMTRSAKGTFDAPGQNVRQKAGLNRSILDHALYERRRQLAYKAPRFGSELRVVPAPGTSQTCSACGHRGPSHGRAAGGCSPAPPAATGRMPTITPHATSNGLPPGWRSTARAVALGWGGEARKEPHA